MKHKVDELEGALLDAAAAECLRVAGHCYRWELIPGDASAIGRTYCSVDAYNVSGAQWEPSTDWGDGGPIIERERIILNSFIGRWAAFALGPDRVVERLAAGESSGPTALIAAMRAYVKSKFGDEVDLP